MADEIKNVFIRHIHEDDHGLEKLEDLLKGGALTIRDSSINSTNPNNAKDPAYIKTGFLRPQSTGPARSWCTSLPRPRTASGSIGRSSMPRS